MRLLGHQLGAGRADAYLNGSVGIIEGCGDLAHSAGKCLGLQGWCRVTVQPSARTGCLGSAGLQGRCGVTVQLSARTGGLWCRVVRLSTFER